MWLYVSKYFTINFQYTVKQNVCPFVSSPMWCPIQWVYKNMALSSLYKVSSSWMAQFRQTSVATPRTNTLPSTKEIHAVGYYFPSFCVFDGASEFSVILEYCTASLDDSAFDLRPLKTTTLSRKPGANHPVMRCNIPLTRRPQALHWYPDYNSLNVRCSKSDHRAYFQMNNI